METIRLLIYGLRLYLRNGWLGMQLDNVSMEVEKYNADMQKQLKGKDEEISKLRAMVYSYHSSQENTTSAAELREVELQKQIMELKDRVRVLEFFKEIALKH